MYCWKNLSWLFLIENYAHIYRKKVLLSNYSYYLNLICLFLSASHIQYWECYTSADLSLWLISYSLVYFEDILLSTYIFTMIISSFIFLTDDKRCPSLLILRIVLFYLFILEFPIKKSATAFFARTFTWHIFFISWFKHLQTLF